MLAAESLTKRYGDGAPALDGFTFAVADGELVALLGANGAGKSTTMRCFLDFTRPTSGRALVDGIDVAREPRRAKARLAYVPEQVAVHESLTGRENLAFFAGLGGGRPLARAEATRALVDAGLPEPFVERPAREYSKGMRQKLGLAIATVRGARNLLLDEPTSGLDPTGAAELMARLAVLRDAGCALLVAMHDVFRARDVADRILVLRAGRLVAAYERADFADADVERLYHEAIAEAPRGPRLVRQPLGSLV